MKCIRECWRCSVGVRSDNDDNHFSLFFGAHTYTKTHAERLLRPFRYAHKHTETHTRTHSHHVSHPIYNMNLSVFEPDEISTVKQIHSNQFGPELCSWNSPFFIVYHFYLTVFRFFFENTALKIGFQATDWNILIIHLPHRFKCTRISAQYTIRCCGTAQRAIVLLLFVCVCVAEWCVYMCAV